MAIFFDAHQQSCFAALFPAMPWLLALEVVVILRLMT
jgi:hypothetical protein